MRSFRDHETSAQLDGTDNTTTLRDPMNFSLRPLLFVAAAVLVFPHFEEAAVIFKPGEKAKYVAPGEEEISGNAEELFHIGQEAEKKGNLSRAIHAYITLVRKHPKDGLATGAGFRAA